MCDVRVKHVAFPLRQFLLGTVPGVAAAPKQTGLQPSEDEAQLGLEPDRVLDQPPLIAQADPAPLQVLFHHLLQLPHTLLQNIFKYLRKVQLKGT